MSQEVQTHGHGQKIAHVEIEEARMERLYVKETDRQVVRFSCWPNGKIASKPLEVTEEQLLHLMQAAIKEDVLTEDFVWELRSFLDPFLTKAFRPSHS